MPPCHLLSALAMVHSHGAIHSARNGTHTTLHTDHFIVATHVVHSQWCMRELLCSFALLRSGMGPHLSAATPGPFTFSCSDCARSRGRCRSRSPESRSARSVESNRVARAERATGSIETATTDRVRSVRVTYTVYTRNGGTPTLSLSLFLRTHAATFQWLPRVLLGSFALLRCEVGATLTAVSAATPAPFTISGSRCARSRGRCRSRGPEC